jgi:hypothetical protein
MKAEEYKLDNGELIKYDALHSRLRRKYGHALICEFCGDKEVKRYEWALKKGRTYSMNIKDYMQLCCSCHRKYDITDDIKNKMSESKKGKLPNNISPVMDSDGNKYISITEASEKTGVSITSIHNNLTGLSKIAGGKIWTRI